MADLYTIRHTQLMFPNFAGKPDKFNQAPKPNTSVVVPPDMIEELRAAGFRIRHLDPRTEFDDDRGVDIIDVKISFGGYSDPKIVLMMMDDRVDPADWPKRILKADEIHEVDRLKPSFIEVTFAAYKYRTFTTAYAVSMYIAIRPDPLMTIYGI